MQAAAASLAFTMVRAVAFCQTLEVGGLDCQAAGTICVLTLGSCTGMPVKQPNAAKMPTKSSRMPRPAAGH